MDKTTLILIGLVVSVILLDKLLKERIERTFVNLETKKLIKFFSISIFGIIVLPILIFAIEFFFYWSEPIEYFINVKIEYSKAWIALYSFMGFVTSIVLFLILDKDRSKEFGKRLIDKSDNSENKNPATFRILFLAYLIIISYFIINPQGFNFTQIFSINSPVEKVKKRLASFKSNRSASDYFEIITPLFEEYYDCLECVEYISHFNLDKDLDAEYARAKISHFSRAIELGSKDLYIYVQDMKYKFFLKDKYGAEERDMQIRNLLNNLDEEDLKPFYYEIGKYHLTIAYQIIFNAINEYDRARSRGKEGVYDVYSSEMTRANTSEKKAFEYLEEALGAELQNHSVKSKENAILYANELANYFSSIREVLTGVGMMWISYVNFEISPEDREKRCLLMSKLGSLGGDEIYKWMNPICTTIEIKRV